jgi:2-(1,2-epoxy-1,2-dihydrophenyl)acetyl-CoA isomerase
MSKPDHPLQLTREGPVASIQLTQPEKLNAIDLRSASALLEMLRTIAADKTVRAVVLSGAGRAFMAGGDVSYFSSTSPTLRADHAAALIDRLHEIIELMVCFPVPILSLVHGAVAGAGLGLMLASDVTIAAADTRFVFAYADLGTSPDGGLTWFLARTVGVRRALHFASLHRQLDAAEALRLGLVQELVKPIGLMMHGMQRGLALSQLSQQAFLQTRRLLLASAGHTLREQLRAEREAFVQCALSDDFAEGINAFHQRRRPQFTTRSTIDD